MIANYDAVQARVIEKANGFHATGDSARGSDEQIRDAYAPAIQAARAMNPEFAALQPIFDELVEFRLSFKVKLTMMEASSENSLVIAHLKHLLQSKEGDIGKRISVVDVIQNFYL
jgi:hypothetical protein